MGITVKYFLLPFLISFISSLIFFYLGIGELNRGTFLGIGNSNRVFISVLHLAVILILLFLAVRAKEYRKEILLILAGSLSNYVGRIIFNGVLDFINLGTIHFNIADIIVAFGFIKLIYKFSNNHPG
jgi:lipoprotein signal peptidase